jgi:hypothetical protein
MQKEKREKFLKLGDTSLSVQTHLSIIQGVIQRMSANSTSCKAWCVAIVSATLVVIADKKRPDLALLGLIPTLLFATLDAYYLALERGFRKSYNDFIDKLHSGRLMSKDMYSMEPSGNLLKMHFSALRAFPIWSFYASLLLLIAIAWLLIL